MNVLLANTHVFQPTGGIDVVNRLTVHTLAEKGCFVDILSLNDLPSTTIDPRYIPPQQATYQAFGGRKLAFTRILYQLLATRRYDLILFDHINIASSIVPWKLVGKKYWVWLFGMEVFAPNPTREGELGLRGASGRLAISEHTRKRVQHRFPHLSIETCLLALDPFQHTNFLPSIPYSPPAEASLEYTAVSGRTHALRDQLVLHVGRMVHSELRNKGQQVLIQAIPQILARHPGAQLLLAGKGPELLAWQEMARQLPPPAPDHIFMPGFVSEEALEALYQQCAVFAMPSLGEGFGLVYLEAMRYAKPCIGARADATPELVHHGEHGLLVDDATSVPEVVDAVSYLLADPEAAEAMGMQGYEWLRNHYLFAHFYDRFWKSIGSTL